MGQNKGNGRKEDGSNCQAVPCGHRGNHHIKLGKQVATVEVTIPMNKRYARAEVQDADMTAAMDKTVDILEGQVVRYKKRMRTKIRNGADAYAAEYAAILVPEESLDDEPLVKIEKVKRFAVKPMDAEEAVMEMELVGAILLCIPRCGDRRGKCGL